MPNTQQRMQKDQKISGSSWERQVGGGWEGLHTECPATEPCPAQALSFAFIIGIIMLLCSKHECGLNSCSCARTFNRGQNCLLFIWQCIRLVCNSLDCFLLVLCLYLAYCTWDILADQARLGSRKQCLCRQPSWRLRSDCLASKWVAFSKWVK